MIRILVITKRQYTNKDLLDDRFGRLRELPLQLALRKHKVFGLCLSYRKKREGKILDGPVEWESINAGPLRIPGLIRFSRRASQLAANADAIWACSDSIYGIIGYLLASKYRIPLVFDLYDNFEYFLAARLPVIKQLYRRAIRKSQAVTCVSQPLARLITSYGKKEGVFVIENGVRKDLFKPMDKKTCRESLRLPQHVRLVGTAGALGYERGTQILLKAFQLLKQKHPDLHLALAGPRTIKLPKQRDIHDLGILPLDKIPYFFNSLDAAIICNKNNDFGKYCFPQKTREIMACDVPLIAARVGSMKEVLSLHPDWLYAPDDANDLALVLENRLGDGVTGYNNVLSWSDIGSKLESIFLKLHEVSSRR